MWFLWFFHKREVEMSVQVNRVTNSASVIEQQLSAVFSVETQLFNDTRVAQLAQGLYADNYTWKRKN